MKNTTLLTLLSVTVMSLFVALSSPAQTLKPGGPPMAPYPAPIRPAPTQPLPATPAAVIQKQAPSGTVQAVPPGPGETSRTNQPTVAMNRQPIFTNHLPVFTNRMPVLTNRMPVLTH